jgi:phosphoesterase RecJ-like protein
MTEGSWARAELSERSDAELRLASDREALLAELRAAERLVVVSHENPDGDALGSLVAMQQILTQLGKDSVMYIAAEDFPLPHEYSFLPLAGRVSLPPGDLAERTAVFLDCGNLDRNPADALKRPGTHILNIDHHHDNTRFGTVNLVVPGASCTAEIVWDLMHDLGVRPTQAIAEALYVGLITDTGRFMYENTGPRAHLMAAELIEAGVDVQAIYRRVYEDVPFGKLALLARCISHVQRFDSGRLTVGWLSEEDFRAADATESYAEGVVDHLRAVRGTAVAALVRERPDNGAAGAADGRSRAAGVAGGGDGRSGASGGGGGDGRSGTAGGGGGRPGGAAGAHPRKVSLRASDDRVDVSLIARLQGGGGHRRAAGFQTTLSDEQLVRFLREQVAAQLASAR